MIPLLLLVLLAAPDAGERPMVAVRRWKCHWSTATTQVCFSNDLMTRTYFYNPKTCDHGKALPPANPEIACRPIRTEPPGNEQRPPIDGRNYDVPHARGR